MTAITHSLTGNYISNTTSTQSPFPCFSKQIW